MVHVPDTTDMDQREARNAIDSACRSHGPAMLAVLFGIATNADASNADRIRAATYIIDRGWGKAAETHLLADVEGRRLTKIVREIVHLEPRPREMVGYKELNGNGHDQ
jgi:hypothetical protein